MAVNVEFGPAKPTATKYPRIRVLKGSTLTILFTAPKVGTVLRDAGNSFYGVGHHAANWSEFDFEDFDGTVTLSNEGR